MPAPTPSSDPGSRDAEISTARLHRRPLLSYLGLIAYKTYADLRAESERTVIGFLWWIIEPLISLLVYYTVFELVFNRGMVDNYAIFLFVGLVPWKWLNGGVLHGAHAIRAARGLMQLVYLPKVVFPIVVVLTDTVKFLVVFVALILITLWVGAGVTSAYLALPLLLLVQGLFLLGLALVVGAVTPFFPDLYYVLENVFRLWFFLSGIFFPLSMLSETAQVYFRLNPMAVLIEGYRLVLLQGRWPDLASLSWLLLLSLLIVGLGAYSLVRNDFAYPRLAL